MKNIFDIVAMPGDGIGPEITAPAFEIVDAVAKAYGITLLYTEIEAGAELYARTGDAFPEENFKRATKSDAIFLAAMGLPTVRYPDGTEIGPQHDLRKRLELYAGVRPCVTMPALPLPLADERGKILDFVIVRESTEGFFAFPQGHELDTDDAAHNLVKVTRKISEKLFHFSFKLARQRKNQGSLGMVTCIDKANVLSSQFYFRSIFDAIAPLYPDIIANHMYVDAAALNYVKKPWAFDVCVTENQFGDILSDLAAALMGGIGMSSSGEIGDSHAVFQPCHGSAPDIAGTGMANPTGMILSGAIMLDYLGTKFENTNATEAGKMLQNAVKTAFTTGNLLPYELSGTSGIKEIIDAVKRTLHL